MAPIHDWREWRRLRAWELRQQGWSERRIAEALDASLGAVSKWLRAARQSGVSTLRWHARPGPRSKLANEGIRLLIDFLWHGPEAYGFRGQVWTCARIASVLKEELDLSYSKSQVSRILKRIGWTPQVPITRAIQRDEEAINHWQRIVWPRLRRQARAEGRTVVLVDESGFYLLPGVIRTYAPRGVTPVIRNLETRDHLSVMAGVTNDGRVFTLARQESLNGLHSIEFLAHLLRHAGDKLLVIWDRSPIHRRKAVKKFVASVGKELLRVEMLPAYAPDLNPTEWLWHRLKNVELRNLPILDLEDLHQQYYLAVSRVRRRPSQVKSLFAAAGLPL